MTIGNKEHAGRRSRFFVSQKANIFFALMFFLCFSLITVRAASAQYLIPSKKFVLQGEVALQYERRWSSVDLSTNRFQHSYTLNLKGFVLDPRLIAFDLNNSFSQQLSNPGNTIDAYGVFLGIELLNGRIKRGVLSYFPQPIRLRFSYFNGTDLESQSYGISLTYHKPGSLRFFHDGKIISYDQGVTVPRDSNSQNGGTNNNNGGASQKGYAMLFPRIDLDYDRYSYKSENVTTDIDMFSLRAESSSLHGEYKAEYDYQKYSGDTDTKSQYLTLRADYHFGTDARSLTDIYNSLLLSDTQEIKTLHFTNNTRWSAQLGPAFRDSIILGAGGDYFHSDRFSGYSVNASGNYTKNFSERTMNTVTANVIFVEGDDKTIHAETVTNQLTHQLSKRILLFNSITAGLSQDGNSYGFGAGVSIRSRIPVRVSYDYLQSDLSRGKRTTHLLRVDSSGRMFRNMNYILRNTYGIIDEAGGDNAFKEKVLSIQGDLYWSMNGYNVNFGGTYVKRSKTPGFIDIDTLMVRARIAKLLTRRLNVMAGIYYSNSSEGDDQTIFNSALYWTFRQVVLSAEYELTRTSITGGDRTDHRLFLRVSRYFLKNYFMR